MFLLALRKTFCKSKDLYVQAVMGTMCQSYYIHYILNDNQHKQMKHHLTDMSVLVLI